MLKRLQAYQASQPKRQPPGWTPAPEPEPEPEPRRTGSSGGAGRSRSGAAAGAAAAGPAATARTEGENVALVGLKNLGNTCYMNSCIQCLSHTYDLSKFAKAVAKDDRHVNRKLSRFKGTVATEFAKLILDLWSATAYTAVTPKALKRELGASPGDPKSTYQPGCFV